MKAEVRIADQRSEIRDRRFRILYFALIIVAAAAFKLMLLAMNAVPFNGDEGVVALMARHILQGERPIFFYGQVYLGSIDAWLVALSFSIFGQSVLAIRLAQLALFIGTLVTTYLVARRMGLTEWASRVALVLLALPPTLLTLYTTATLGGYGETLLLGNVLILIAIGLSQTVTPWQHTLRYLLFGLVAGFAFWTFPLILIYLIPISIGLLVRQRWRAWRGYALAGLGLLVGSAPWWLALIQSGGALIAELTGSAVASSVAAPTWVASLAIRLLNFFLFGASAWFGLRYPWSADFVLPALGLLVLAIYFGALVHAVRRGPRILWGMIGVLLLTFLLTPFGGDPSGRYFLPLYLPLVIFTARLLQWICNEKKMFGALLLILILGYNVTGTLSAASQPPGLTTQFDPVTWIDHRYDQALIDFLLAHGETRGYTNYWVQTPIAFLSNEQVISAARLPYHLNLGYTRRDDRYPPYSQAVAEAPRAFYITTNHPTLDALIRDRLTGLNVSFQEQTLGNYHVFFALSRKVTPEDLEIYDTVTR